MLVFTNIVKLLDFLILRARMMFYLDTIPSINTNVIIQKYNIVYYNLNINIKNTKIGTNDI